MDDTRRTVLAAFVSVTLALDATADVGGVWLGHTPLQLARQESAGARIGGEVFVVGGLITNPGLSATATVERYDLATGVWSFVAPLPAPRDHLGVCASGGRLYAIGGFAGDFAARSEVWRYDPGANAWTPRAPLPSARGGHWAVAHQSKIYVFGGVNTSGAAQRTTFVYDVVLDSWTPGADMPTAREHLMADVLGNFVHVVGGRNGASTGAHERYDPVANTWTVLPPLPTPRSAAAMATFHGRLVVCGGEVPVLSAKTEIYDPSTNAWTAQDPMVVPRHGAPGIALDESVFVPGGGTIQGLMPTSLVNEFRPLPADAQHACTCAANAPCGNTATEAGCRNSTGAGAELTASGVADVGSDSLILWANALPNGATTLFFQGTSLLNAGNGIPFQDGLRCAGGTITRLGSTPAVNNWATYPQMGNPPVSQRGSVPPGATRSYQAWYRNPLGPCGTGSNLTNALQVVW